VSVTMKVDQIKWLMIHSYEFKLKSLKRQKATC